MGSHHRFTNALWLIAVVLTALSLSSPQSLTRAQTGNPSYLAFTDNFDSFDTTLWHKADGWSNDDPFNCGWQTDNATVGSGTLSLQIDDQGCPCNDRPYAAGEYRSNGHYLYGTYTVSMKAVAQEGVVSSFFIYTGPSEGNPWDEIDIEIIGKSPSTLQTNYVTDSAGEHEAIIDLGFDASAAFHTYSIEWLPDEINWYVDGLLKHTENGSRGALPSTAGRIMMNFWPGITTDSDIVAWLGIFSYSSPIQAQYSSVSFEPMDMPLKSYLPLIVH